MQLHCVSGNVLCKIKHQTDVSKHVLVEEHLRIIGNIFDISIIGKCLLSENVYYMSIIGKRLLYVYYRKISTFFLRKWVEQQKANKLDILMRGCVATGGWIIGGKWNVCRQNKLLGFFYFGFITKCSYFYFVYFGFITNCSDFWLLDFLIFFRLVFSVGYKTRLSDRKWNISRHKLLGFVRISSNAMFVGFFLFWFSVWFTRPDYWREMKCQPT